MLALTILKAFSQFAPRSDYQEQFSIITVDGVYNPARMPQGATDSAIHYQNQNHNVYFPLLHDN